MTQVLKIKMLLFNIHISLFLFIKNFLQLIYILKFKLYFQNIKNILRLKLVIYKFSFSNV